MNPNTPRRLAVRTLRASDFAPFGEVIEARDDEEPQVINRGNTLRYPERARVDTAAEGGRVCVSLYRTSPLAGPLIVRVMERHPLGSQLFYPLSGRPWLVVVAPPGDFDANDIVAFRANANQGVNLAPGTWHHFSLALETTSDFLVVDRAGPGEATEEIELAADEQVVLDL